MRPAELDALIEQGPDVLKAAVARHHSQQFLSAEELQIVEKAIAKFAAIEEAPAEEPTDVEAGDSEPERKAEKSVATNPRRSTRTKGK